jgi:PAS domain S-box-containing protein
VNSDYSLLKRLFEGAPVGLAIWDSDLRLVRVNETLAELHGVPAADHPGRTLSEVIGPLGLEAEDLMRQILATGEPSVNRPYSGETPAAPGEIRHWLATHYPLVGPGGSVEGVGGVILEATAEHRVRERERAARANAEALVGASIALSSSMDPAAVLDELARAAIPALGDWAAVHVDGGREEPELSAVAHVDPALREAAWRLSERYQGVVEDGEVRNVLRTGAPLVYADVSPRLVRAHAQDPEQADLVARLGVVSAALVPLEARGRVAGVLSLMSADPSHRYDDETLRTAEAFARQAALALDNAQLYNERRTVAQAMQRSLLPRALPEIGGLDIAVRYRAAGRSNEVGGDLYDVFSKPGGPCAFTVADVVGKGPEAAAITALVRHTLRAAHLHGDSPEAALHLLNEALLESAAPTRMCTAVYGNLSWDGDEVAVRLAVAGHPPPLVLGPASRVDEVDAGGLLLGVARDPEFGTAELRLGRGQALVLYTDGITELRDCDPAEGERLLRDSLAGVDGRPAVEMLEAVERAALMASGGSLRDDMALLALHVVGDAGPA